MTSEVKVDKLSQKGSTGIVITDDIKLSSGKAIKNAAGTDLLTQAGVLDNVSLGSSVTGFPSDVSTFARWRTTNGFGSTDDKIFEFTDADIETNSDASGVVEVTNTAANGFRAEAKMDCYVFIHFTQDFGGAAYWGISKNSDQLTTSILSITATHRMMTNYTTGIHVNNIVSWSGPLSSGDIVRPHNDGGILGGNPGRCLISVFAMKKL